jgi:uncharacterized protein YjiK
MPRIFTAFLILFFILFNCTTQESSNKNYFKLELISSHHLNVPEPSGLCLSKDKKSLYTVSDASGDIYNISLDGKLLRKLNLNANDPEGIALDSLQNFFWIAEESGRQIKQVDMQGNVKTSFPLDLAAGSSSGLEGIAAAPDGHIWLVHEKNPRSLLKLNSMLNIEIEFNPKTASDYSGLCSDTLSGRFWILSDQDEMLFLWDESEGVLEKYSINIKKAEGLAIDFQIRIIYVVSDSEEMLYLFKMD